MSAECPSANALAGFAAGGLDGDEAAAIEAHIDGCDACRSALSSAVRGAAPEPRFGRYRVDTVLGAGGMGLVYRAFDPELSRAVAIKVVRAREGERATDGSERARLAREARSLARLSHPNVCHVYDVGEHEGEVWVAMELVDGVDLRQWAAGRDAKEVVRALLDAARGIAAAHDAGLVHRDVKPQNVLVTRDGRAVVTDFGLARGDERATTSAAAEAAGMVRISGTPAYLAPEQLTGAAIDARVDQFAWAVMAWELLAGERPFPIEPAARLAAIRAGLAVRPGLGVPAAVGAVLARAMAAAPRDRFASMGELIAAFEAAAARAEAAPAVPASRRRARVAGMAGAAVVVGAALAGAAYVATRDPDRPELAASVRPELTATVRPELAATVRPERAGEAGESKDAGADASASASAVAMAGPDPDPGTGTGTGTGRRERGERRAQVEGGTEVVAGTIDAGVVDARVVDTAPAAAPVATAGRFDRARAERRLADCRFPVDPARPDPALAGQVIDWGPITRRETVIGVGKDGEHTMNMYEIRGARATYRFDGDAFVERLGSLDASVGDLVVVCPFALPAVAEVDHRQLPPGWRAPTKPIYAFAPSRSAPATATRLAELAPLHVTDAFVRSLNAKPAPVTRHLLVLATPKRALGDALWDMGGWWLDARRLAADEAALLAAKRPVWLVVSRPAVTDGVATLEADVALRRLLD